MPLNRPHVVVKEDFTAVVSLGYLHVNPSLVPTPDVCGLVVNETEKGGDYLMCWVRQVKFLLNCVDNKE